MTDKPFAIIYAVTGIEGDPAYFGRKSDAVEFAKEMTRDGLHLGDVKVERLEVTGDLSRRELVVNLLRGEGWCDRRDVVFTA